MNLSSVANQLWIGRSFIKAKELQLLKIGYDAVCLYLNIIMVAV